MFNEQILSDAEISNVLTSKLLIDYISRTKNTNSNSLNKSLIDTGIIIGNHTELKGDHHVPYNDECKNPQSSSYRSELKLCREYYD